MGAGDFQIQGATDGNTNFHIQGATDGNANFHIQGPTDGGSQAYIQGAYDASQDQPEYQVQYQNPQHHGTGRAIEYNDAKSKYFNSFF